MAEDVRILSWLSDSVMVVFGWWSSDHNFYSVNDATGSGTTSSYNYLRGGSGGESGGGSASSSRGISSSAAIPKVGIFRTDNAGGVTSSSSYSNDVLGRSVMSGYGTISSSGEVFSNDVLVGISPSSSSSSTYNNHDGRHLQSTTTLTTTPKGLRICHKGSDEGWVFPLLESERGMNRFLQALIYLSLLLYTFIGIGIGSDVFMGGIEAITSMKKVVTTKEGKKVHVDLWNETVATLTLMALGSSAPEILLATVEVYQRNFFAGEMGSGTIVGSGSFNLFIIIALCMNTIPDGENRRVRDFEVYCVCSSFMMFAYAWLAVCLLLLSPGKIDIFEGVFTLLMFPLMVFIAYKTQVIYRRPETEEEVEAHYEDIPMELPTPQHKVHDLDQLKQRISVAGGRHQMELAQQMVKFHAENPHIEEKDLVRIAEQQMFKAVKMNKARQKRVLNNLVWKPKEVSTITMSKQMTHFRSAFDDVYIAKRQTDRKASGVFGGRASALMTGTTVVNFQSEKYTVVENMDSVVLVLTREGSIKDRVRVDYCTRDGTAVSDKSRDAEGNLLHGSADYKFEESFVIFEAGEDETYISIRIFDDENPEEDEIFYVDLTGVINLSQDDDHPPCEVKLGKHTTAEVLIIDDDGPGMITFLDAPVFKCKTYIHPSEALIVLQRRCGVTGAIGCRYRTVAGTATPETDYDHIEGFVEMRHAECSRILHIPLKVARGNEGLLEFRVILDHPVGFRSFNLMQNHEKKKSHERGESPAAPTIDENGVVQQSLVEEQHRKVEITVQLSCDNQVLEYIDGMRETMRTLKEQLERPAATWWDGMQGVFVPDVPLETWSDYVGHIGTMPWKFFFNIACPPPDIFHGIPTFLFSLSLMGVVVGLVNDIALMLGCAVDIPNMLTALTLVAAGTSLPDAFASKIAAERDEYADESITNVTGSNSVNVFLGLGLPWTIASCYWSAEGQTAEWREKCCRHDASLLQEYPPGGEAAFIVNPGNVGSATILFLSCAAIALAILRYRRLHCGGELGGEPATKKMHSSILCCLWVIVTAGVALTSEVD